MKRDVLVIPVSLISSWACFSVIVIIYIIPCLIFLYMQASLHCVALGNLLCFVETVVDIFSLLFKFETMARLLIFLLGSEFILHLKSKHLHEVEFHCSSEVWVL